MYAALQHTDFVEFTVTYAQIPPALQALKAIILCLFYDHAAIMLDCMNIYDVMGMYYYTQHRVLLKYYCNVTETRATVIKLS